MAPKKRKEPPPPSPKQIIENPCKLARGPNRRKTKSDPAVDAIVEAIGQVEGLNAACRRMLLVMIPNSLCVPSDERHEGQKMCVEMIGEALQSAEASLKAIAKEAKAQAASLERTKASWMEELTNHQAKLTVSRELVSLKRAESEEAGKSLVAAELMVSERHEAQRKLTKDLEEAKIKQVEFANANAVEFKAILEANCDDDALRIHYENVEPLLLDLKLDSSLMMALPATCVKRKADRSDWDEMVLEGVKKSMTSKPAELAKMLDDAASLKESCSAAVESVEKEVEVVREAQARIDEELSSAVASEKEVAATAVAAQAEFVERESELRRACEARDVNLRSLELFRTANIGSFELLRDRTSQNNTSKKKDFEGAVVDIAAEDDGPPEAADDA